jgi:hypothetical protein
VKKGGARLLGRAAVRPFNNIINDLKFRLRPILERAILPPFGAHPPGTFAPKGQNRPGPIRSEAAFRRKAPGGVGVFERSGYRFA